MKSIVFIIVFALHVNASFNEGRALFDAKCSSCHTGFVDLKIIKENFFQKSNTLLNLKAPTENMLIYAILKGPKSIGVKDDDEMRHIEIEEYFKNHLEEPNTLNSICERSFFQYYATKSCDKIVLSDEEAEVLADFVMEYKAPQKKQSKKEIYSDKKAASILHQAKDKKQNILIYATSKTCHFCKEMEKKVLSLSKVQKKIEQNFIYTVVDVDEMKLPFGIDKKYEGMTPTFFFVSPDAKVLNDYPGAWVEKDFLEILDENRAKK